MSGASDKATLRARLSELRRAVSTKQRDTAQHAIFTSLLSLEAWQRASLVAGYVSVRGELDLTPVWQAAVRTGKGYALPCSVTDAVEGRMIFRRMAGFAPKALAPARFGIPEPLDTAPMLLWEDWTDALIIVPGLAFDDLGFRIGYGGGYYDRFLAELRARGIRHTTVGLVFATCHLLALPHEPHDIPVDIIVDERRIIHAHGTHGDA